MPKMVIEVPEEFSEVGKAMAEHLAALQRTVSRLGGGKAVDYAEIEQAMAESARRPTTRWWVRSPWRDRCTVNRGSVGGSRAAG